MAKADRPEVLWFNPKEFSEPAREILTQAYELSPLDGPVGARHVACALFVHSAVGPRIVAAAGANLSGLQADLTKRAKADSTLNEVGDNAEFFLRCVRAQRPSFGPKDIEDVVLAVFEPPFGLQPLFAEHGLTMETLRAALPEMRGNAAPVWGYELESRHNPEVISPAGNTSDAADASLPPRTKGPQGMYRKPGVTAAKAVRKQSPAPSAEPSQTGDEKTGSRSALASCATELVQRARDGLLDPVIGRDEVVTRTLQVLSRRTKNNVCLVGAPGVGKTAIAEAVAQRIASGKVPPQLAGCRELWSLDIGALLAGTGLRGDFEERLRAVLTEIRASEGQVLLFIDELHLVLGAGRSENNNIDAANLMKPMLARGEVRCIGATTTDEYRRLIAEKDAAFERRFQTIDVREPDISIAVQMLHGLCPLYASHHGVEIAPDVCELAVRLSVAHIHGRSLPDKAIDVLDETCCLAVIEGSPVVTAHHVSTVVAQWKAQSMQRKGNAPSKLTGWFRGLTSRL